MFPDFLLPLISESSASPVQNLDHTDVSFKDQCTSHCSLMWCFVFLIYFCMSLMMCLTQGAEKVFEIKQAADCSTQRCHFYRFLLFCLQSLPFSRISSAPRSVAFSQSRLAPRLPASYRVLNFLLSDWADDDGVGDCCKPACRGVGGDPGVWYYPEAPVWARSDRHEEPGKQLLPQFCHASALHRSRLPEQVSASFIYFHLSISILLFSAVVAFSRL